MCRAYPAGGSAVPLPPHADRNRPAFDQRAILEPRDTGPRVQRRLVAGGEGSQSRPGMGPRQR
jgi:hypothetical protein